MNAIVSVTRRRHTPSSLPDFGERLIVPGDERGFGQEIEDGLDVVEAGLLVEMSFADDLADVTSRYRFKAGGHRIRPLLTLLAAQLGAGNDDLVYAAAKAIEITRLASLYHDDVMDESRIGHGIEKAEVVRRNSVAILTGDLLLARANKLVSSLGDRVIQLQADTFERLCLGQLHETIGPREGEDVIEHYMQVLADKTGSVAAAATEIGAVCSGAAEEYRLPVKAFGEKIGIAIALIDDTIDLESGWMQTGGRARIPALPLLYLRELAETDDAGRSLLARIERDASALAAGVESEGAADLDGAIAALRGHEVTARALATASRWARAAVDALAPLPDTHAKLSLTRFAEKVIEHSH